MHTCICQSSVDTGLVAHRWLVRVDGLRQILKEHWHPDRISAEYVEEGLEAHNLPEEMIDLLTNGIEEALCRGFLEEHHALFMAVRRVQLLIEKDITLPLARDKERVWQLIREKEEDDWKGIVDAMGAHYYFE